MSYRDSPVFPTGHPVPVPKPIVVGAWWVPSLDEVQRALLRALPPGQIVEYHLDNRTYFAPRCGCVNPVCQHEDSALSWVDAEGRRDWAGRGE